MNTGKTIFAQLMDFLPLYEFRKCVRRYRGDYKIQSFSCLDQFLCMAFAQLTYRESLRDIETCLRSMHDKLYHMGFRGNISRNTLSNANNYRDWRIYSDFAHILIRQARELYRDDPFAIDLKNAVYAFDATTIDLCLSLFPWAHFEKGKAAIQLHTLLDLRSQIPVFIEVTDGNIHEINILDNLIPEPGAFYILDRGYIDFERLYTLHQNKAFFVIRSRSSLNCQRIYSRPVDKSTGLICDQTIILSRPQTAKKYPEQLRRVKFFDHEHNNCFVFLTNNFSVDAFTVTQLYKSRWKIELFFKWIKQHLRIKAFFGTSPNAVKTQIWIAISVYVLIAIVKKRLNLKNSLYTILQILSLTVFEKTVLSQVLTTNLYAAKNNENGNQLQLFDL